MAKKSKKKRKQNNKKSGQTQQIKRQVPKRSNPKPKSMDEQKRVSNENMQKAASKPRKIRKTKTRSLERRFWIIIFVAILAVGAAALYYVFEDFSKDADTPGQSSITDLSDVHVEFFENLGMDKEGIEEIKVQPQGPIVYVIYTVPAGTPRANAIEDVTLIFQTAINNRADLFENHEYQITIINSGEEAEGVNDYPIAGSKNLGSDRVVWMSTDGNYTEPTPEEAEAAEEAQNNEGG